MSHRAKSGGRVNIERTIQNHVEHILAVCMQKKRQMQLDCVIKNCKKLSEPPREAVTLLVLTIKGLTEDRMEWKKEQQVFWVFTAAFFLIIVLALMVAHPTPSQF